MTQNLRTLSTTLQRTLLPQVPDAPSSCPPRQHNQQAWELTCAWWQGKGNRGGEDRVRRLRAGFLFIMKVGSRWRRTKGQ